MRAIDLCAGAGGLSLGLQRAGWDVLGVEHDADACATHLQVGPCERADIRTWSPPHDALLVAGGVPCQSFSQAGQRKGLGDPRGQLYLHLLRIAREANARAVLLENVRGLVYRGLDEIRTEFERQDWLTSWALLDAADYGTPQHRRRLFLLGLRERLPFAWPAPTHGPGGLLGLKPWVTVRDALGLAMDAPAPTVTTGEQRACDNRGARGGHARPHKATEIIAAHLRSALDDCAPTVSAGGTGGGGGPEPFVNAKQRGRLMAALETDGRRRPGKGWQGMRVLDPDAPAYSVGSTCAELVEAGLLDRPATAVQAGAGGRSSPAGHHARQFPAASGPPSRLAVRLTVAQLAALQGFPPNFTFGGALTSQHRQVGNAVPPQLAEAVGRAVCRALVIKAWQP